jgi:release factor glutamine methyltransferase
MIGLFDIDRDAEPIYLAAGSGDWEAVARNLQSGADKNYCGNEDDTLLIHAACQGCLEVVNGLIDAGADINKTDDFDKTALQWAIERGHSEVAAALEEASSAQQYQKSEISAAVGTTGCAEDKANTVVLTDSKQETRCPDLSHFGFREYDEFYEPSDDTFLFLDALEKERKFLEALNPSVCMELGPGSGCISAHLATVLQEINCPSCFMCSDINRSACRATLRTARQNQVSRLDTVTGNLLSPYVSGKIDVLLFNPPYVPTPSAEVGTTDIAAAWAGGKDGREVIDKLLPVVKSMLSPKGAVFYLLLVDENRPAEIRRIMRAYGFIDSQVNQRRARNELLSVLKFELCEGSGQAANILSVSLEELRQVPPTHQPQFLGEKLHAYFAAECPDFDAGRLTGMFLSGGDHEALVSIMGNVIDFAKQVTQACEILQAENQ